MGLTRPRQKPDQTTAARLEAARAEVSRIEIVIIEAGRERDLALLDDDAEGVRRAEAATADLEKERVRAGRRVTLLAEKLAAEQRAAQERVQADLLVHAETKLTERDAATAELATALGQAFTAYEKVLAANAALSAAFPWDNGDVTAALLGTGAMASAVKYEIFRAGGGDSPRAFPGGACPTPVGSRDPAAVLPLVEAIGLASKYARKAMRESSIRLLPLPSPSRPVPVVEISPTTSPESPADMSQTPTKDEGKPAFAWLARYVRSGTTESKVERIAFGEDEVADSSTDGIGPAGKLGRAIAARLAAARAPEGFIFDAESLAFDFAGLRRSLGDL